MSDIMSFAISALKADQTRLEQYSINAANATTPGFKRGVVVAQTFESVVAQHAATHAAPHAESLAAKRPTLALARSIDFTAAATTVTGRSLDVALGADQFLTLTDGAQTYISRNGSLSVDSLGVLRGAGGHKVMGLRGDIVMTQSANVTIDSQGKVWAGDQELGQLRLSKLKDVQGLSSRDGIVFQATAAAIEDVSSDRAMVKSGELENSNTNHLREMMGVLENTRHFESVIRLVQGYDEVLGKAIQRLGEG